MPVILTISLAAVFICVASASALAVSGALAWFAPERRRLRDLAPAPSTAVIREGVQLVETSNPALRRLSLAMPKSPKEVGRLRRQLGTAGYYDLSAAVYFSAVKVVAPMVAAALAILMFGVTEG